MSSSQSVSGVDRPADRQSQAIQRLVDALRRYSQHAERVVDGQGLRVHMNKTDVRALSYVMQRHRRGVTTTPTHLASFLTVTLPTVTAAIDRLIAAGLVAREPARHDRRRISIVPTPKAIDTGTVMFQPIVRHTTQSLSEFSARELETARDVLEAATTALLNVEREWEEENPATSRMV